MIAIARLKNIKPLHWIYNFLHLRLLLHNKFAYRKYGLKKSLISSISSKDFPDKSSQAWLDTADSADCVASKEEFASFSLEIRSQLLDWSKKGYLILPAHFNNNLIQNVNEDVHQLVNIKKYPLTHDRKLLRGHNHSKSIYEMMHDPSLIQLMSFILGKEVVPFHTLNFIHGSSQRAHSDSIHMTTYPLGYLIAAWIALEDIHPDSGPLFYYPGSHQLPFLLNDSIENYSSRFRLGKKPYTDYEEVIEKILEQSDFEKTLFLAKKGDVLVWHANLIHGGMPVINPNLTRKSMVIHYFAKDVIKYHEITERPSLIA